MAAQTGLATGQSKYASSRVVVARRRISSRPCPLSRAWAWSSSAARRCRSRGGNSRAEGRRDVRLPGGLIRLDRQEIILPPSIIAAQKSRWVKAASPVMSVPFKGRTLSNSNAVLCSLVLPGTRSWATTASRSRQEAARSRKNPVGL